MLKVESQRQLFSSHLLTDSQLYYYRVACLYVCTQIIVLIHYRDCTESAGLSTQQHGDAGALVASERRFLMVRLHSQMVTPESIDPGIEWE